MSRYIPEKPSLPITPQSDMVRVDLVILSFRFLSLSAPQPAKSLGFAHAKAGLETRYEGAGAPFGMSLTKQG